MSTARRAAWSIAATVVLTIRLIATIATVGTVLVWLVAAVRDGLLNGWLWWAVGSAGTLIVATYLYSHLRVRYPSTSDRWEE
ncbi:hypothetical protein L5G28_01775 [Gordonia sp. HY285]|uniref:Uncharacterized protein n=1 Tax=Gordonia liuliyuniae TaxID=2911517 RepID=A0ABS9INV1_9ACTN|nr:hypothetical protein [Gordonia liuliyuniae]MCF8587236.1 hypothetical protein [Gordonia liuliyuniae]MCF8608895.1 hypothetical protein [Gordonia liuliyuniae]